MIVALCSFVGKLGCYLRLVGVERTYISRLSHVSFMNLAFEHACYVAFSHFQNLFPNQGAYCPQRQIACQTWLTLRKHLNNFKEVLFSYELGPCQHVGHQFSFQNSYASLANT